MAQSLEVAVIGAGASGLIAARELRREGHRVVIFEKLDRIGGIWVYDPRVESDPLSHDPTREIVYCSLYHSLRTNLPRPLMSFSEFSFEERDYGDPRAFPGHAEVLAYLNDFATRFGIVELIRFNSEVVRVEALTGRVDKWVVEWKSQCEGDGEERVKLEEKVFDAVVVCNGHFTQPRLADIRGIENWPGKQIHSHNYRIPAPYKDQVVVVIGKGPSGHDISREISKVAKEVHISSRSPDAKFSKLDHYSNIWQHSAIYMVKQDSTVEFEDGSSVKANVILHCTGYKYEFPFLKTNGIVSVDDNRVGPLYKHVFPPQLAPRLSFVGLTLRIIIFDMMELQSKWIAKALSGKVVLPSEEEMMVDVKEYYQQMMTLNRPKHLTHSLFNAEQYLEWLAKQGSTSPAEDHKWKWELFVEIIKRVEIHHQDGYRDEFLIDEWRGSV